MAENQFYSFEEALKELRLKEEELKRLVSEGEIRAFREGDTMKLRRADVENLRAELSGGEVVDLGDVKEEIVFEDDTVDADAGMATQEIGMATEEIVGNETVIDDGVEDVGEIEVPADEAEPVAPLVRSAPAPRAPEVPETYEGVLTRSILVLTAILLVLGIPLAISVSTGKFGGLATAIAGLLKS